MGEGSKKIYEQAIGGRGQIIDSRGLDEWKSRGGQSFGVRLRATEGLANC
jgi:hypothetical protein